MDRGASNQTPPTEDDRRRAERISYVTDNARDAELLAFEMDCEIVIRRPRSGVDLGGRPSKAEFIVLPDARGSRESNS